MVVQAAQPRNLRGGKGSLRPSRQTLAAQRTRGSPEAAGPRRQRRVDSGDRKMRRAAGLCDPPEALGHPATAVLDRLDRSCPLRARSRSKPRATTVTRGQEPTPITWADAGHSPCSLSLPSWDCPPDRLERESKEAEGVRGPRESVSGTQAGYDSHLELQLRQCQPAYLDHRRSRQILAPVGRLSSNRSQLATSLRDGTHAGGPQHERGWWAKFHRTRRAGARARCVPDRVSPCGYWRSLTASWAMVPQVSQSAGGGNAALQTSQADRPDGRGAYAQPRRGVIRQPGGIQRPGHQGDGADPAATRWCAAGV